MDDYPLDYFLMHDEVQPSPAQDIRNEGSGGSGNSDPPLLGYASGIHYPAERETAGEAYRDGGMLICLNGTTLPPRCVLCGDPGAGAAIRLTLTWDSSFRLTHVSTLELRKKANVYAFLCAPHRRVWSRARLIGGIGASAGLSIMAAGAVLGIWSEGTDNPIYTPLGIEMMIAGFAVVIVSMFFFTLRSRTLSCRRIQEGYLYLEDAADSFLDCLPELPHKSIDGEGNRATR
jgi:hypothetical protein